MSSLISTYRCGPGGPMQGSMCQGTFCMCLAMLAIRKWWHDAQVSDWAAIHDLIVQPRPAHQHVETTPSARMRRAICNWIGCSRAHVNLDLPPVVCQVRAIRALFVIYLMFHRLIQKQLIDVRRQPPLPQPHPLPQLHVQRAIPPATVCATLEVCNLLVCVVLDESSLAFESIFILVCIHHSACQPGSFATLCPLTSGTVANCTGQYLSLVPCEIPADATELWVQIAIAIIAIAIIAIAIVSWIASNVDDHWINTNRTIGTWATTTSRRFPLATLICPPSWPYCSHIIVCDTRNCIDDLP